MKKSIMRIIYLYYLEIMVLKISNNFKPLIFFQIFTRLTTTLVEGNTLTKLDK